MIYMLRNKLFLAFLLVFLTACSYRTSSVQLENIGYIKFFKNSSQTFLVKLNDAKTFKLGSCFSTKKMACHKADKSFVVKAGVYKLKVYDTKGKLLLDEKGFVGLLNTKEIRLNEY